MSRKTVTAALAAGLISASAPAFALSGIGCPDLPLYYRAVGTVINGGGACGLTRAQAEDILAREKGPSDSVLPNDTGRRARHRQ